jgi:hypothetical protein
LLDVVVASVPPHEGLRTQPMHPSPQLTNRRAIKANPTAGARGKESVALCAGPTDSPGLQAAVARASVDVAGCGEQCLSVVRGLLLVNRAVPLRGGVYVVSLR